MKGKIGEWNDDEREKEEKRESKQTTQTSNTTQHYWVILLPKNIVHTHTHKHSVLQRKSSMMSSCALGWLKKTKRLQWMGQHFC